MTTFEPWHIEQWHYSHPNSDALKNRDALMIVSAHDAIAEVFGVYRHDQHEAEAEQQANARLISAAPKMFELLTIASIELKRKARNETDAAHHIAVECERLLRTIPVRKTTFERLGD